MFVKNFLKKKKDVEEFLSKSLGSFVIVYLFVCGIYVDIFVFVVFVIVIV